MTTWEDKSEKELCEYYGYNVSLTNQQQNDLNLYLSSISKPKDLSIARAVLEWAMRRGTREEVTEYTLTVQNMIDELFLIVEKWCLQNTENA